MKFLFDLFPVILFFTAFKFAEKEPDAAAAWLAQFMGMSVTATQAPILIATVVVIVATLAQVAWVWFRHGKVDRMLWFSLVLVVVFGGMTLAFSNAAFIQWKPTILYWGMALGMAVATLAFGKNAIKAALGEQLQLPDAAWARLNMAWIAFFVFMGVANFVVAFHNPLCGTAQECLQQWVNFKLFGGMGLLFAFVLVQGAILSKYMEEKS